MKAGWVRIAITIGLLLVGLLVTYRVWSVSSPGQLWQPGDWWVVRVQRPQSFLAQPSPPWAEVNRIRFEVTGVSQSLAGPRVGLRLTFSPAVLGGYAALELAYDSQTLAVVEGRLIGRGLPDLDWSTARPLLEASLVPLDGSRWRRASLQQVRYSVPESERAFSAYRVVSGRTEYVWSREAPWWLSFAAGDQVRAELLDCSYWQPGAAEPPPVLPVVDEPAPAEIPASQATVVLDYALTLRESDSNGAIVAVRQGQVISEQGLGTQVLSLGWGTPEQRIHLYVSIQGGSPPELSLDKVVVNEPAYAVYTVGARATFADGRAVLDTPLMVGTLAYVLQVECVRP